MARCPASAGVVIVLAGLALGLVRSAGAAEGLAVAPASFAPHVLTVPGEAMLIDPPGADEDEE